MAADSALERDDRQMATLELLVAEKVTGDHALFFEVGEGRFMPHDLEEMTGYVVDRAGRVYRFELGWDASRQAAALTRWESVQPKPAWEHSTEYRRAREAVGLS
jgi:hypothetical protein